MIPVLRSVVKYFLLFFVFGSCFDDFLERGFFEGGAFDQLVQRIDIGFVMLAVMEFQRLGRHMRRQRIFIIRQEGEVRRA